ncbi:hypothetical protein VTO73DRAFT_1909 [Trametes versicolor]
MLAAAPRLCWSSVPAAEAARNRVISAGFLSMLRVLHGAPSPTGVGALASDWGERFPLRRGRAATLDGANARGWSKSTPLRGTIPDSCSMTCSVRFSRAGRPRAR